MGLWDAEAGIKAAFSEIEDLAQQCKFRDCSHTKEQGCAVREAVEEGALSQMRLDSYLRLKQENDEVAQSALKLHASANDVVIRVIAARNEQRVDPFWASCIRLARR